MLLLILDARELYTPGRTSYSCMWSHTTKQKKMLFIENETRVSKGTANMRRVTFQLTEVYQISKRYLDQISPLSGLDK